MIRSFIELREFKIKYQPHMVIKDQVVARFIVEFIGPSKLDMAFTEQRLAIKTIAQVALFWHLYVDGTSNEQDCEAS